jgi:mannosyl-oligosaccharide alpha-1,2-mannosidase
VLQAKDWVDQSLSFANVGDVSVFETTIRALGGLLGAYTLSKDAVFLTKATELGDKLLAAFNSPSKFPWAHMQLGSGAGTQSKTTLAEVGSCQLEFGYLSHLTGNKVYAERGDG